MRKYSYSRETRLEAIALFEHGSGYVLVGRALGIPKSVVEGWWLRYMAFGPEAVLNPPEGHARYTDDVRLAAVKDYCENGLSMWEVMRKYNIRAASPFNKWVKAYREGAPLVERRGRPPGTSEVRGDSEDDLRARIARLECELEIEKRITALTRKS